MTDFGAEWPYYDTCASKGLGIKSTHNRGTQTFLHHRAGGRELSHLYETVYFEPAFRKGARKVMEEPAVSSRVDHSLAREIARHYLFFVGKRMAFRQDANRSDIQVLAECCRVAQKTVSQSAIILFTNNPFQNSFWPIWLKRHCHTGPFLQEAH